MDRSISRPERAVPFGQSAPTDKRWNVVPHESHEVKSYIPKDNREGEVTHAQAVTPVRRSTVETGPMVRKAHDPDRSKSPYTIKSTLIREIGDPGYHVHGPDEQRLGSFHSMKEANAFIKGHQQASTGRPTETPTGHQTEEPGFKGNALKKSHTRLYDTGKGTGARKGAVKIAPTHGTNIPAAGHHHYDETTRHRKVQAMYTQGNIGGTPGGGRSDQARVKKAKETPYSEGRKAMADNIDLLDNPYHRDHPHHEAWNMGWKAEHGHRHQADYEDFEKRLDTSELVKKERGQDPVADKMEPPELSQKNWHTGIPSKTLVPFPKETCKAVPQPNGRTDFTILYHAPVKMARCSFTDNGIKMARHFQPKAQSFEDYQRERAEARKREADLSKAPSPNRPGHGDKFFVPDTQDSGRDPETRSRHAKAQLDQEQRDPSQRVRLDEGKGVQEVKDRLKAQGIGVEDQYAKKKAAFDKAQRYASKRGQTFRKPDWYKD